MTLNTPFSIVENRRLECQFGPRYYKEKPQKSTRVRIQGSRKMGCLAHITIKKCILYPDYLIQPHENGKGRTLREKKMAELKANLSTNAQTVTSKTMYYVSLPTEDSHQGHPTGGGIAGFAQRVNDKVAVKISELRGSMHIFKLDDTAVLLQKEKRVGEREQIRSFETE